MEPARASSSQREQSLRTLGTAYRDGMLSTGTFELRVGAALSARTVAELQHLVADVDAATRLRMRLAQVARALVTRLAGPPVEAIPLALPAANARSLMIGRDSRCDIVYSEPTVSRFHASLRREAGGWVVHDLGSLNGTWVNGRRATGVEVRIDDVLQFGDLTARVVACADG